MPVHPVFADDAAPQRVIRSTTTALATFPGAGEGNASSWAKSGRKGAASGKRTESHLRSSCQARRPAPPAHRNQNPNAGVVPGNGAQLAVDGFNARALAGIRLCVQQSRGRQRRLLQSVDNQVRLTVVAECLDPAAEVRRNPRSVSL